tara:strand:+ start:29834 stop:30181 length:348 start_codon:yes stop_codon:yes gene_type:complete
MLLSVMTSMLCYYNIVRHEVYTELNADEEIFDSTFPYDAFPVPKAGAETTTTDLKFFRGQCAILICFSGRMRVTTGLLGNRKRSWSPSDLSSTNIMAYLCLKISGTMAFSLLDSS